MLSSLKFKSTFQKQCPTKWISSSGIPIHRSKYLLRRHEETPKLCSKCILGSIGIRKINKNPWKKHQGAVGGEQRIVPAGTVAWDLEAGFSGDIHPLTVKNAGETKSTFYLQITMGTQNHEIWRFYTPNIWVITPKNEGFGFPWYTLLEMNISPSGRAFFFSRMMFLFFFPFGGLC